MLNKATFIMYDFETGGKIPTTCQAIQIAAVAIEPRNLEIIPDSEFESLILPEFDEEKCKELEIEPLQDQALAINGKTREELKDAPTEKSVFESFKQYVMNFNSSGKQYDAPILVGFNNLGFDDIILNRMAKKYGPWNSERECCGLFNKFWKPDLMQMLFPWFESSFDVQSISMDNMRGFLGMSKEGGHDALVDVQQQAQIFIQLMKTSRKMSKMVNWRR